MSPDLKRRVFLVPSVGSWNLAAGAATPCPTLVGLPLLRHGYADNPR